MPYSPLPATVYKNNSLSFCPNPPTSLREVVKSRSVHERPQTMVLFANDHPNTQSTWPPKVKSSWVSGKRVGRQEQEAKARGTGVSEAQPDCASNYYASLSLLESCSARILTGVYRAMPYSQFGGAHYSILVAVPSPPCARLDVRYSLPCLTLITNCDLPK